MKRSELSAEGGKSSDGGGWRRDDDVSVPRDGQDSRGHGVFAKRCTKTLTNKSLKTDMLILDPEMGALVLATFQPRVINEL